MGRRINFTTNFRKIEVDRHTISKILKIYNVSEKEIFRRGIGRPIIQYDLKGNFLNRYDSITDAANSLKKENISAIRNCCMRRIKSAYNFLWKFEDDDTTIEELVYDFNLSGKGQYKKVEQYDLNGKFISEFDSCREAARSINAPITLELVLVVLVNKKSRMDTSGNIRIIKFDFFENF